MAETLFATVQYILEHHPSTRRANAKGARQVRGLTVLTLCLLGGPDLAVIIHRATGRVYRVAGDNTLPPLPQSVRDELDTLRGRL